MKAVINKERIREECTKRGWSIEKLSRRADLGYLTTQRICKGESNPDIRSLAKICGALDLRIEDILSLEPV